MNLKEHALVVIIFLLTCCQKEEHQLKQHVDKSFGKEGVINDEFMGAQLVVYANGQKELMTAFSRGITEGLNFGIQKGSFPNALLDQYGNTWNVFGEGASESNKAQKLDNVNYLVGYWFLFPAFFNEVYLFNGEKIDGGGGYQPHAGQWSISTNFLHYGSFQDGIPSIDNPLYFKEASKDLIDDPFYKSIDINELVTVISYDGIVKIYPHQIMDYHEVVNDDINRLYYALSYCPLTGTSRIWNREMDGKITEFGVSGLLFNNNLVLYDRLSGSYWSQVLEKSIHGEFINSKIKKLACYEMKYIDALNLEGEINILKTSTGFNYNYSEPLYKDYKENDGIYYPVAVRNDVIHPKERVLGIIIGDKVKVYRFSDF